MDALEVTAARSAEEHIIQNMMQLYVHDFSEHWSGTDRGELEDDGFFPEYPLEPYWREPDHIPLLLRVEGRIAGFALLNARSHSGLPVDQSMAEFFVVRKHRRDGIGKHAAHIIFDRYPGQWEAAVARKNLGALAFWRNAARLHPRAEQIEEIDRNTEEWNGPILRFRIPS
jgi:predicted acetyltransferase